LIAKAYGREGSVETYRCRYGVVPALADQLFGGALRAVGFVQSDDGDLPAVHAIERTDHPFFVATLFQSERAALQGQPVPLAAAFVRACVRSRLERDTTSQAIR
jgi:CTP synthase (UTP-ammonia lyase)